MRFENNNNAVLNKDCEVPFLTFPVLSSLNYVKHGFSTRLGGVSKGHFASMNLGYSTGDNPDDVDENYRIISRRLGFSLSDMVISDQVHKTDIKLVTAEDKGKGTVKSRDYKEVDGLITNETGIVLTTYYADCVPLYFVDTKNHAIGLSHSGWRGTIQRMGRATLNAMNMNFGTNPEDVIAVIGPSICGDCYEVSSDVAEAFQNEFTVSQQKEILKAKGNDKYQLNLWQANRHILLDAGMQDNNIHISGVCTCCNSELLFSHRASQGKRGTLAAFLMLI